MLGSLNPHVSADDLRYSTVRVAVKRASRTADLVVTGPDGGCPASVEAMTQSGDQFWPLRAFRELDDALLRLRFDEPEIGTIVIKTEGDPVAVLALDLWLHDHREHWLVREIVHFIKRTLKRLDLTSRSLFAVVEPGSCFAGSLFELALASDRIYMLNDPDRPNTVALSPMNAGMLPMGNGLSRLQARFYAEPDLPAELLSRGGHFTAGEALECGLVSFAPDDLDWDDEVRLAVEERASLSPDALTAMEANLRLVGPETMETKIFGRLSAWQNWIFQRPTAVGARGALKVYGSATRAEFDWKRT